MWADFDRMRFCDLRGGREGGGGGRVLYLVILTWGTVCTYNTWIWVLEFAECKVLSES